MILFGSRSEERPASRGRIRRRGIEWEGRKVDAWKSRGGIRLGNIYCPTRTAYEGGYYGIILLAET